MFDQFTIYDVMYVVGLDTSRLRSSGGYYDCPICGGRKKFNVNPSIGHGGVCRCAKCSAGGDKLDLYILYQMNPHLVSTRSASGSSVYEKPSEEDRSAGMKELEKVLRLTRSNPGYVKKAHETRKRIEEEQKEPPIAAPEVRNAVYTAFLRLLSLTKPHREALRERGLADDEIEKVMFRSTPNFGRPALAQKLIGQGLCLENVPGFFKTSSVNEETGELLEQWSIYCPDTGYFVPIRDRVGNIVSMQIRLNKPTTDKDKYRFFSSYRDTLEGGVGAVSEIHVEMCSQSPKMLYVIEGPIKGHVSHALYKRLYEKDDAIFLCIVGTSNFGKIPELLEFILKKYDVETVVEFYDLDKFTNEYVARDRKNLESAMRNCLLKLREELATEYESGKAKPKYVSYPRERYFGKGVDDHLLAIFNKTKEDSDK